jgi:DHA3 family macrolide efflux protein-like MFS transporter
MDIASLRTAKAADLFRNRSFLTLWVAQFAAIAAIYSLGLAGAVFVEDQTHSSTQTSLVILSAVLPAFLGSLVAGTVVDRWGRKRVLVASLLARGLAALAFWGGTLVLPPGVAIATVYAATVAGTAFTQFATPAELAMLPDLVDHESLVPANALLQISTLIAEGLGIVVLSPLLIKLSGPPAVGFVSGLLCLLAMLLVTSLPPDPALPARSGGRGSLWKVLRQDFGAGWLTITRDRLLRLVAIQATLAATLLLVLLSLLPGLVARHLGLATESAPLVLLPGGLGFLLGGIILSRSEAALSRPAWIATGLLGFGAGLGLLATLSGQEGRLWFFLPLILGIGVALAFVIITARVVLQERPPANVRGRVIAAQLALANAAAILPLLLGGSLADRLGIRPVMGALGLLALCAGIVVAFQARAMKGTGTTE